MLGFLLANYGAVLYVQNQGWQYDSDDGVGWTYHWEKTERTERRETISEDFDSDFEHHDQSFGAFFVLFIIFAGLSFLWGLANTDYETTSKRESALARRKQRRSSRREQRGSTRSSRKVGTERGVGTALNRLKDQDPQWRESRLQQFIRNYYLFMKRSWSEQDLETLELMLAPEMYKQWQAQLEAMQAAGQHNHLELVRVLDVEILNVKDYLQDDLDSFSALIASSAIDYTLDAGGAIVEPCWEEGRTANPEKKPKRTKEVWNFDRQEETWVLEAIDPASTAAEHRSRSILVEGKTF